MPRLSDYLRDSMRDDSRDAMTHTGKRRGEVQYTKDQLRNLSDFLREMDTGLAGMLPQMDRGAELTEDGWRQVGQSPEQAAYNTAGWLMPAAGISDVVNLGKEIPQGVVRALGGGKGSQGGSLIKDWRWRPEREVQEQLGLTEVPEYIQEGFGRFMEEMAQKAKRGDTSARDLIKAFTITRSSIQRQGQTPETLLKYWPDFPLSGEGKIRPEGAFSEWLLTPGGQDYLNAAERGELDLGAVQDAMKKMTGFGKQNDLAAAMADATKLPGQEEHVGEMVALAYDKPGSVAEDWRELIQGTPGISAAKAGFIGSLLGKGDLPTMDSRQLVLHTGRPSAEATKYKERGKGLGAWQGVDKLAGRQERMNLDLNPELSPFYQHLAHHSVWDKYANEVTTHDDLKRAMLLAANADADKGLALKGLHQYAVGAPEFRQASDDDLASALAAMRQRNTGKGLDPDADTGAVRDEIARRNGVGMLGLPEDHTAMDRAAAMYPTEAFHGGRNNISEFDPKRSDGAEGFTSGTGTWFDNNPEVASEYADRVANKALPDDVQTEFDRLIQQIDRAYARNNFDLGEKLEARLIDIGEYGQGANVMPSRLGLKNPLLVDGSGITHGGIQKDIITKAKRSRKDGVIFKGITDNPSGGIESDQYLAFKPNSIRSRFGAFDPALRDSPNLLYSTPAGLDLARLYQLLQAREGD